MVIRMSKQRIYVDVHVLQTLPPSCLNRDDTGSPKTAVYGGVTRARVSSQAWKRAVRNLFPDSFPEEALGYRTKKIVGLLARTLTAAGFDGDPEAAAQKLLEAAGLTIKNAEVGTDALFFTSQAQLAALAKLALNTPDVLKASPAAAEKKAAHVALQQAPGLDIALFGRMVADDPSLNTDAAAQVAHAISTHKVANEYDYFTAVDDLSPEDSAGAAHIGMVEFNSSTMYRYATLAHHLLREHLGDDSLEGAAGFVRAFITSMPTGKQNTFANRTLPDAVMVTVRRDQPVNLVGAFEKPVQAGEEGYVTGSVERLKEHAQRVYEDYAGAPEHAFVIGQGLEKLGERVSLDQLIEKLREALAEAEAEA